VDRIHWLSLRCRFFRSSRVVHRALPPPPQELEGDDDLQEKLRRRKQFDDNDEDMYGVGLDCVAGLGLFRVAVAVERCWFALSGVCSCLFSRVSDCWSPRRVLELPTAEVTALSGRQIGLIGPP